MTSGGIIDNLNIQARTFALKWKTRIRKATQLKHFAAMDDDALIAMEAPVYSLLSNTLDRGLDRTKLGEFFVRTGKERMKAGFPLSELVYALNLSQQTVIEYVMSDMDSSMRMYQAVGTLDRVAEFFLLGAFYLCKGFLESIYTGMAESGAVSEDFIKKYFRDDFFLKGDD